MPRFRINERDQRGEAPLSVKYPAALSVSVPGSQWDKLLDNLREDRNRHFTQALLAALDALIPLDAEIYINVEEPNKGLKYIQEKLQNTRSGNGAKFILTDTLTDSNAYRLWREPGTIIALRQISQKYFSKIGYLKSAAFPDIEQPQPYYEKLKKTFITVLKEQKQGDLAHSANNNLLSEAAENERKRKGFQSMDLFVVKKPKAEIDEEEIPSSNASKANSAEKSSVAENIVHSNQSEYGIKASFAMIEQQNRKDEVRAKLIFEKMTPTRKATIGALGLSNKELIELCEAQAKLDDSKVNTNDNNQAGSASKNSSSASSSTLLHRRALQGNSPQKRQAFEALRPISPASDNDDYEPEKLLSQRVIPNSMPEEDDQENGPVRRIVLGRRGNQ